MLTKASFRNFKALRTVDVDLSRFTVFVGTNGSGKTSILQGIHYASQVSSLKATGKTPNERIRALFGGVRHPGRLITRPRSGPMAIALTDEARTLILEARLPTEADEDPQDEEKVDIQFQVHLTGAKPPSIALPGEAEHVATRFLRLPEVRRFGSAVFLHLDASDMVRPSIAKSDQPRLEYNGAGLASVLSYMAGAMPEVLEQIRADLSEVVPQVRGIRTYPEKVTRRWRDKITVGNETIYPSRSETMMGFRFALDMGEGRIIPADMLSEGTVLALGLLTVLRQPQCPRLVLMDDVDGALHSTAQAELVRCLRAVLASRPEVQILCTSHSPDLLDHVELEEVRVLASDKDGYARCGRLGDHPESGKWRKMLRPGEFWASVGEDWLLQGGADGH